MKTLTFHVEESIYGQFKEYARSRGLSAAELIREAMVEYLRKKPDDRPSLKDIVPSSLSPRSGAFDLASLMSEMSSVGP